jgi:peptidoglycan-N-acetylglucosamine deacetylase
MQSILTAPPIKYCALIMMLVLGGAPATGAEAALPACATNGTTLGVSRIVEIDTSTGALFGALSAQAREARFLQSKEVVLTFDDGPMPTVTRSILDTLDRNCTKATFFQVGKMAIAYPSTVRNILARGHTVGSHTWSHPLSLRRLSVEKANEEIEKGFAAVTLAAGEPVAPFFRFPGLSDSGPMLKHLQQRGIAAFTVDTVSNDSYISDSEQLLNHTLKELEAQKGGIVLFHDIKPATARMLPKFLAELHKRGYTIVHMRSKGHVLPLAVHTAKIRPLMAKITATAEPTLMPFYGLVKPGELDAGGQLAVSEISPVARVRPESKAPVVTAKAGSEKTAVRGWSARNDQSGPTFDPSVRPSVGTWGTMTSPAR